MNDWLYNLIRIFVCFLIGYIIVEIEIKNKNKKLIEQGKESINTKINKEEWMLFLKILLFIIIIMIPIWIVFIVVIFSK